MSQQDQRKELDDLEQQEEISKRLREARESLGLSQEEVADALGVARPTISAIETSKRRVTSLELKAFSRLYRRDYEYLLDGNQTKPEDEKLESALFRTTRNLSDADREKVLQFAEFLRTSSPPPSD